MPRPEEPPRSKRPRAAQACDRCRSKKYKCDELYPCSHCKKSQLNCVYQGNYRQLETSRSASYVQDLERKIEDLSSKLQAAESKFSPRELGPPHPNATPSSMPTDRPTSRQEREEPVPYAAEADAEESSDPVDDEISELNHHTNGIEFHGSTSSVAFLGHLQKARDPQPEAQWPSRPQAQEYSIVSTLHNASFSPTTNAPQSLAAVHEHNYYFEQAHVFMSGYFENIHFIHPFIDKEDFYLRAQDLWMRRTPTPDPGFIALYLSVLSFGALLRVWDEAQLGGLTRFEWSRKLFSEAQVYLNYLHFPNNLDAVQCWYLMAKICQNELNPNLAYMYLGLAVRTSLAAGFNRNVRHLNDPRSEWISKTWWGLYSLEIEMSFSLGRPDTLGLDDYHNRPLPPRDSSQYAIIPWMVDFARITRKVSVQIYHRRLTLKEKLAAALAIEAELDAWVAQLPGWIRPGFISAGNGGVAGAGVGRNDLKDPKWARRQRLVLGIRYYNVKTLLFRPFLRHSTAVSGGLTTGGGRSRSKSKSKPGQKPEKQFDTPDTNAQTETDTTTTTTTTSQLSETITKCLNAAQETISVIHDIYRVHTFFRCWWYNTTYVTFATSTLLLPLSLSHSMPSTPIANADAESITRSIEKAIEILEATDESVVTRKCAEIIRCYLREFQARDTHTCGRGTDSVGGFGGQEGTGAAMGWVGASANAGAGAELGEGFGFAGGGGEFDVPDWAYGFGFPDYSFEGIARFFDDLGGLPILDDA